MREKKLFNTQGYDLVKEADVLLMLFSTFDNGGKTHYEKATSNKKFIKKNKNWKQSIYGFEYDDMFSSLKQAIQSNSSSIQIEK